MASPKGDKAASLKPPAAKPAAPGAEGDAAPETKPARKRVVMLAGGLAAVLLLGGAGYFGYRKFLAAPPPPPPPPAKKTAPAPATKAPVANNAQPTPSDAMNKVAHAPANAINKAQDAVAARSASGQTRVEGEDVSTKAAVTDPAGAKAGAPKTKSATAVTSVAPGVTATTRVEAPVEANPAFTTFITNAKISGVVWGAKPSVFINGKLVRAGEIVDPTLGITFDGVDIEKRQVLFKDKSGATVARRQ